MNTFESFVRRESSKQSGIEPSPRRRLRYRRADRAQTPAPEFPRPIADPARFGGAHCFGQALQAEFYFEAAHVRERSQVHRLSKNSVIQSRLRVQRGPPKILLLQLGRELCREAM